MRTITETRSIRADTARRAQVPADVREVVIADPELKGFRLRVRRNGASYAFEGRVRGGRVRKLLIGDAAAMTAAQARTAAQEIRSQLRSGIDPVEARRSEALQRAAEAASFVSLYDHADSYMRDYANGRGKKRPPRPRSVDSEETDVRRAIKLLGAETSVAGITTSTIRGLKVELEAFDPSTAKKTFGAAKRLLDRAVALGLLDSNPAIAVPAPTGCMPRERYLDPGELGKVWHAAGELGEAGRMVRFLIAQPVRVSVASGARWQDIDLGSRLLTVPAEATGNKARREWLLPLTIHAIQLIGEPGVPSDLLFRSPRGNRVSIDARFKKKLDALSGVTGWVIHDFRRTCQTLLGDAVEDLDVDAADLWLMHSRTGIKAVYQRSQRVSAQRTVAAAWDRVLADAIAEQPVPTS